MVNVSLLLQGTFSSFFFISETSMKVYIYMYELKLRYSLYHSDYLTSAVRFSKLRSFREAKKYIQTTMLGLTIDIFVFVGKLKFYLL